MPNLYRIGDHARDIILVAGAMAAVVVLATVLPAPAQVAPAQPVAPSLPATTAPPPPTDATADAAAKLIEQSKAMQSTSQITGQLALWAQQLAAMYDEILEDDTYFKCALTPQPKPPQVACVLPARWANKMGQGVAATQTTAQDPKAPPTVPALPVQPPRR